jgi:catechol 2,3-dioxygenase-like lactoylglutathione lyase family enzyme
VRAVSIPAENQDDALRFYVGTLGFTALRDTPTPAGGRFIELAPGHTGVVIALEPAAPASGSPPTMPTTPTPRLRPPTSTPTKSSAGQQYRPCSRSATPTATPSRPAPWMNPDQTVRAPSAARLSICFSDRNALRAAPDSSDR